jgi:hypothetical protein
MADQDFGINIRTVADITGVRKASDAIAILNAQAKQSQIDSAKAAQAAQTAAAPVGRSEADRIAGHIETSLLRTATHAAGIGFILELVGGLKKASEEIQKVSELLDKQGEELVKHAQLYGEEARHAKDQSDVLKVSSETLKDIESTQKTFNDLSAKQVNWAAQFSDYLQKQLLARQRAAGLGDYEAARQAELQTAQDQALAARQRGMQEVLAAEKALNQTTEQHLATINREIDAEEKRKAAAAVNNDPGGYVKAANNLAKLRQEREKLAALEEQERQKQAQVQDAAYGAASPQAKAILENEKRARETGDQAFQKTADQLRASATPADLAQVQAVADSYGKAARPGRAAGVGESQDLVDQIERQRIAAENAQKPTAQSSGEQGTGGPSMTGEAASAKRHDESMTIWREMLGVWRGN